MITNNFRIKPNYMTDTEEEEEEEEKEEESDVTILFIGFPAVLGVNVHKL